MELKTRRLLLRPLRDDDAHAMALALNNYEVVKNLSPVPFPYRMEDAQFFINLQRSFDPRSMVCAIAFRCAPDELIGLVSYKFDDDRGPPEFGYWLRQCCWRMGIMTEAATALVKYAFETAKVDELHSGFWNPISGKILLKIGFEETHQTTIFSVAQKKDLPSTKLRLTRETWLAQQKGRAA